MGYEKPLKYLWAEFRDLLELTMEVTRPSSTQETSAKVTVTVTNRAVPDIDSPRIEFEDVTVTFSSGNQEESFRVDHNRLAPGESARMQYEVKYLNLALCKATVQGRVALETFAQVHSQSKPMSGRLNPSSYFAAIRELDLPGWLARLRGVPQPTTATTLGQLESLRQALRAELANIRATAERLQGVVSLSLLEVRGPAREAVLNHHERVTVFFRELGASISRFMEKLGVAGRPATWDLKQFEATVLAIDDAAAKLNLT
ncbi:MAG: hypothetical protein FJ039_04930 [Chloroflexi bacterium]|nr:hypothetical protein [Chloroflexota bacterium]